MKKVKKTDKKEKRKRSAKQNEYKAALKKRMGVNARDYEQLHGDVGQQPLSFRCLE
jgi:hypothetical protein